MTVYNWNAIYLGQASDIDSDESTVATENPDALLGTWGSQADPLFANVVDVAVNDADADTNINTDNSNFAASDPMTINGVAKTLDSGTVYNATITYTDGTTATITAVIIQTTDGSVYLAPEMSQNADHAAMQAKPIESLTLDSVLVNPSNVAANRQSTNFVCYANGTLIATTAGPLPVETLAPGDLVLTLDRGPVPLRWIGSKAVDAGMQRTRDHVAPVVFAPGSLGSGLPEAALRVSQQHRILLRSPVVQRMFGVPEVLVAAKDMLGLSGVALSPGADLRYYHLAFDRHEILCANGASAESLYLGSETRRVVGDGEGGTGDLPRISAHGIEPARPLVRGRRARALVSRLAARAARTGRRDFHPPFGPAAGAPASSAA